MDATEATGVLIVDPDPRERGRLAAALEARGWRVWAAADGPSAVRAYRERSAEIRAALVDLQLPGLEWSRVLAELGRLDPHLLRCATAAGVSPSAAAAFRRLSDTPLFPKPVRVERLDAALREMAAGRV
jgi:DNA-binding NtrC family response regulator